MAWRTGRWGRGFVAHCLEQSILPDFNAQSVSLEKHALAKAACMGLSMHQLHVWTAQGQVRVWDAIKMQELLYCRPHAYLRLNVELALPAVHLQQRAICC